jgi:hypothetical protein
MALLPLQTGSFEQTTTFLYTYFHYITPWSRVLLEKLIGPQLVKKFPAFYGTRRFITAFTRAHHLSLSFPLYINL